MLESTAEAYRGMVADITNRLMNARGTINAATGEVLAGVESFNQALKLATQRLVRDGLTGFVDGGGRHWQPETYVAMTMRSTYHNVSQGDKPLGLSVGPLGPTADVGNRRLTDAAPLRPSGSGTRNMPTICTW